MNLDPDPTQYDLVSQLIRSCEVQVATKIGEIFGACERACLADVIPPWDRLLLQLGIEFGNAPTVVLAGRWSPTLFDGIRNAVGAACRNAESLDAQRHWRYAETLIRSAARQEARHYGLAVLASLDPTAEDYGGSTEDELARLTRLAVHYATLAQNPKERAS